MGGIIFKSNTLKRDSNLLLYIYKTNILKNMTTYVSLEIFKNITEYNFISELFSNRNHIVTVIFLIVTDLQVGLFGTIINMLQMTDMNRAW